MASRTILSAILLVAAAACGSNGYDDLFATNSTAPGTGGGTASGAGGADASTSRGAGGTTGRGDGAAGAAAGGAGSGAAAGSGGSTGGGGSAGSGGGADSGGSANTGGGTGSGGATGSGGTTGTGGGVVSDGGVSCQDLSSKVASLLAIAQICTGNAQGECASDVKGVCCPVVVASPTSQATTDYLNALAEYSAKCHWVCPAIPCRSGGTQCGLSTGGGTRRCLLPPG